METFKFFYQYNKKQSVFYALIIAFNGLLYGLMILFANQVIEQIYQQNFSINYNIIAAFLGVILLTLFTARAASMGIAKFSLNLIHDIRMQILYKIKKIEYQSFEKLGEEDLYTTLIKDSATISEGSVYYFFFLSSIITLLFCLIYMAFLNLVGFLAFIVIIGTGFLIYQSKYGAIMENLTIGRELEATFIKHIEDLIKGFKEIRISKTKEADIYENYLKSTSAKSIEFNISSWKKLINNNIAVSFILYLFIGGILFIFPSILQDKSSLVISFLLLILFMMGPMNAVIQFIPTMSKMNVAVEQIKKLERQIMSIDDELDPSNLDKQLHFESIEFIDVYFTYDNSQPNSFMLGPINLKINKGDSHLIFGENGGGKTTLIKLITGLYKPYEGQILVNGIKLSSADYSNYRDLFSVVYSDFYLFENLYGTSKLNTEKMDQLLEKMKIQDKVEFLENRFSTINLSTGQRKRLALILSIIEDKPIIVLDEWAAEQDPDFKRFFYTHIIPELEAEGSTIIMISHDDRFFSAAKKVYKMSDQVVSLL